MYNILARGLAVCAHPSAVHYTLGTKQRPLGESAAAAADCRERKRARGSAPTAPEPPAQPAAAAPPPAPSPAGGAPWQQGPPPGGAPWQQGPPPGGAPWQQGPMGGGGPMGGPPMGGGEPGWRRQGKPADPAACERIEKLARPCPPLRVCGCVLKGLRPRHSSTSKGGARPSDRVSGRCLSSTRSFAVGDVRESERP